MDKYRKPLLCLLGTLFLLSIVGGPAAARSRGQGLEGLLERHGFSAPAQERIARSYDAALQAGVEEDELRSVVESVLEGRFNERQLSRILSLLAQLELAALPSEGFVSKLKEGVTKGVAPDKLLGVVERRALMLRRSASLLDRIVLQGLDVGDRDELLPAVVTAFEEGRDEQEVYRILTSALEQGQSINRIRKKLLP